jgi:protein-S-isoprenylcysteine O-methyltransferase Ste14
VQRNPLSNVIDLSFFSVEHLSMQAIMESRLEKERKMTCFPGLKLGLWNGWIVFTLLGLTDGIIFLLFPQEVVRRLWDRSGWEEKQVRFTVAGKVFAAASLLLLALTPLKIGQSVFIIGLIVSIGGLVGLVKALFDFKNTPFDQPVERGIYRISRHPQIVMSSLVLIGGCIAVGSWAALAAVLIGRALGHFGILGEEEACLEKYGAPYHNYLARVPRYFLFF